MKCGTPLVIPACSRLGDHYRAYKHASRALEIGELNEEMTKYAQDVRESSLESMREELRNQ